MSRDDSFGGESWRLQREERRASTAERERQIAASERLIAECLARAEAERVKLELEAEAPRAAPPRGRRGRFWRRGEED